MEEYNENNDLEEMEEEAPNLDYINSDKGKLDYLLRIMESNATTNRLFNFLGKNIDGLTPTDILDLKRGLSKKEIEKLYNNFANTGGKGKLFWVKEKQNLTDMSSLIGALNSLSKTFFINKHENDFMFKFIFLQISSSTNFYLKNGVPEYITPSEYVTLVLYKKYSILAVRGKHIPQQIISTVKSHIMIKELVMDNSDLMKLLKAMSVSYANFHCEGELITERGMRTSSHVDLGAIDEFKENMTKENYTLHKITASFQVQGQANEKINFRFYPSSGDYTLTRTYQENLINAIIEIFDKVYSNKIDFNNEIDLKSIGGIDDVQQALDEFFN